MTLNTLAGTGTRVVEASSAGLLSASALLGMDFITSASPTAAATSSINSCFSATYENYLVVFSLAQSASVDTLGDASAGRRRR